MILVAGFVLAVLSVPVLGGSLSGAARLRWRARWCVVSALGLQVLVISLASRQLRGAPGDVIELVCYGLAVAFLVLNRRVRWLWLAGLGGLCNLAAIGANAGVMPASRAALAAAGRVVQSGHWVNSTALASPRLSFLGDIFAIPKGWPLSNVFSIGDVLLLVGAGLLLHWACGSRLALARRRSAADLA